MGQNHQDKNGCEQSGMVVNLLYTVQAGPIMQPQQMQQPFQPLAQTQPMQSEKSWVAVLLLCLLGVIGIAGIDRFYTGRIILGILKLLTFGGLGLWTIIDVILIVTGNYKDGNGNAIVVS